MLVSAAEGIEELAGERKRSVRGRHEGKDVRTGGEHVEERLRIRDLPAECEGVLGIGDHPGVLAAPHPDLGADGIRPGRRCSAESLLPRRR